MNAMLAQAPQATFAPSPKQLAIFKEIKYGLGSLLVIAVAGSGKSTTMVESLAYTEPRDSILMLAFNSTIAADLRGKIADLGIRLGRDFRNVRACTFHALGYSAICKRLGRRMDDVKPDGGKVRKLARKLWDEDTYKLYGSFCVSLVGMAKGEGLRTELCADEAREWERLVDHHDLTLDSEEATMDRAIELARELLVQSNKAAIEGSIDFDDQIYLPVLWKLALWQNRFVYVDEAQDTNPVRRALARKALKPAGGRWGGRLVAVGDPKQSIYGFTGASTDAMDLLRSDFGCTEMPLTVSYRCPKAVGRVAADLVPYFEVHESAPEGEVLYDVTVDELLGMGIGSRDAVLCRNTRPLVALAYRLLAQGVACRVLGSEIGKGLIDLVEKMNARTVDGLRAKLTAYRDREVAKAVAEEDDARASAVEDRVACVLTFMDNLGENERTIGSLVRKIEALFGDGQGDVLTLCTAHKAKGKEWPTVAILEPQLMPGRARRDWQHEQELNLMYVAATRAQERLVYMAPEEV